MALPRVFPQRIWRKSGKPGATLLFLVIVALSLLNIVSSTSFAGGGSRLFRAVMPRYGARIDFGSGQTFFVRAVGRLSLIDLDRQSADLLSSTSLNTPNDAFTCAVRRFDIDEGLYAATEHREGATVSVSSFGTSAVPIALTQEILSMTANEYARDGLTQAAADIRAGGALRARILWFGYLHNTLVILSLIGLPLSLRWIPGWLRDVALSRRDRRRAKGLCGTCGYDLRDDTSGVCPECGNYNYLGS